MPRNRASQISLQDTPYYHCVSRCVRRGFLCGEDALTGRSYEHRRQWVEDRLLFLASLFAIDICAYAVMSNHTHVVLHVDTDTATAWNDDEVLKRYHSLHKGTLLTQKYSHIQTRKYLTDAELYTVKASIDVYRQRLCCISWFMRSLNEYIAREANKEDNCTGRFWEGRFKSQALLDEAALLSCMAYVDLNPVRAKIAKTPETSAFTSIKQRAEQSKHHQQPRCLMPFIGNERKSQGKGINFNVIDYLTLLDETGKIIRHDKRGSIENQEAILNRLGLDADNWFTLTTFFEKNFTGAAGREHMLRKFHSHQNSKRAHNAGNARRLFGT